ncbi:MAG: PHP domain-containing protein [Chloroflexota bacterium]
MAEVDLHLHTTESDGRLTPAELVALAVKQGLRVIAITDHDTTDGLDPAWKAAMAYPYLTVIAGIELSTDIPGNEIHILGYYIDHRDISFQLMLQQFRESRVDRAQKMVEKLGGLGMPLEWDRVKEIAGQGSIGRPHVAEAMLEKGYISYFQEAFEKYIGRNGPAYVEREKQIPEAAVQLIGAVGGIAVLAHPAQVEDLDTVLQSLKAAGLKGMEVHYAQYDEATVARLAALAKRYDLLPCGGSDYHAIGTPGEHLPGKAGPPMWVAEELRDLAMEQSYGRFG